jgi:hypothetical protein
VKPDQFLQTLYYGDRACKAVLIDSWKERISFQIDKISRLKPGTKTWDFYTDADIKDAWLIFSDVWSIQFEPSGPIPNDLINEISVGLLESPEEHPVYLFELSIDSVDDAGKRTEVIVRIEASRIHLENPARPGIEIVD